MFAQHTETADCIDRDHYERSPSTGYADTARILDAEDGTDHALTCDAPECDRSGDPVTVRDGGRAAVRRAVRCSDHVEPFVAGGA